MVETHKSIREIHQIGKRTKEFLINPGQCPPLNRHGIHLTGISCASEQFQFVRHHPAMHQILVCFRGAGEVFVDGNWKRCTSGMAYVTPAGHFHAYHGLGKKNGWEVGWCIYDPLSKFGAWNYWQPLSVPFLLETDPRQLESILQGLYHESSHASDVEALEYWTALLNSQVRRVLTKTSPRLWRLWQAVQSDLSYPWTLADLARKSGCEMEQLRRISRRETGRSPMRHVAYLRMQHAISLLVANQKIAAVSDAVGYETPFAFSIAFKRIMGCSPSHFGEKKS